MSQTGVLQRSIHPSTRLLLLSSLGFISPRDEARFGPSCFLIAGPVAPF